MRTRGGERGPATIARGAAGGMTLVEVLVTMVVLSLLLMMVGSILVSTIDSEKRAQSMMLRERAGSAILDLIARDVESAYCYGMHSSFTGKSNGGSGSSADSFEFVAARPPGRQDADDQKEQQRVQEAFSTETQQAQGSNSATGGITQTQPPSKPLRFTRVGYQVKGSSGYRGLYALLRSEQLYVPTADEAGGGVEQGNGGPSGSTSQSLSSSQPAQAPSYLEVFDRVKSFQARYLYVDKTKNTMEWRDSWAEPDLVPAAVEITLEIVADTAEAQQAGSGFGGPDRPRKIYRSVIPILASNPPPDAATTGTPGGTTAGRTTTGGTGAPGARPGG